MLFHQKPSTSMSHPRAFCINKNSTPIIFYLLVYSYLQTVFTPLVQILGKLSLPSSGFCYKISLQCYGVNPQRPYEICWRYRSHGLFYCKIFP